MARCVLRLPGWRIGLSAGRDTVSGTSASNMASTDGHGGNQGGNHGGGDQSARRRPPEWADGLKQLYDSVVEEALPDSFKDLIDRLDAIPPARSRDTSQ